MLKYAKIQNLCLLSLLALSGQAVASPATCLSTVFPDLCEKLMSHQDGDWVGCQVIFNRPPVDTVTHPKTDPITKPPHAAPDTATPSNFIAYTQAMFGKYDFRLWEDFQEQDSVAGVTIPPWSFPTQIAGSYRGYATKQSILSLAAESYIQVVEDWQPPVPVSLLRAQRLFSKPKFTHAFNIKGQRLRTKGAPTLMIRKPPGGP